MNITIFWLLLIPVILSAGVFFFTRTYHRYDKDRSALATAAATLVIGIALTVGTFYIGLATKTTDTEILNGKIIGKSKDRVSCEHSYQCNCRNVCSGSGSSQSCSTQCDTCYEHSFDNEWNVQTSISKPFEVDRIDRQGLKEPPRWNQVSVNQPFAIAHNYTNYVKAVPESVIHYTSADVKAKYADKIPEYPDDVYDYHYVDRVIPIGVNIPNLKEWNLEIANMLRDLGPSKQLNVVILVTNITDKNYTYAVRDAWLGGKKNDVVIIVSAPEYPKIEWVHVMSWSDREIFKVKLRDSLQEGLLTKEHFSSTINFYASKYYARKQFAEFKYLEAEIDPPDWAIWLGIILNVVVCGAACFIIYRDRYKEK